MTDQAKARILYLHIGTEKTGSTTLQNFGNLNRRALHRRGVLYPRNEVHSGLSGYAAAVTLAPVTTKFYGIDGPEDLARFRDYVAESLQQHVATGKYETVWLTSERLSAYVRNKNDIEKLARLGRSIADEIKIVIYVRDQADLFLSAYSSGVKAGRDADMNPPVKPGLYYYDYYKLISRWARVFGEAAMVVRPFDRRELVGGDIVTDFFSILGVKQDESFKRPPDRNQRLDAHTLQFLRLFNRFVGKLDSSRTSPLRGTIAAVLTDISDGPQYSVPQETVEAIRAAYAESNAMVARQYLGREDGVLFVPPPYKALGVSELTVENAVEIAAKLWVWQQARFNKSGASGKADEEDQQGGDEEADIAVTE